MHGECRHPPGVHMYQNKNRHARGQSRVGYGVKLRWKKVVSWSVLQVENEHAKGVWQYYWWHQDTLEFVN